MRKIFPRPKVSLLRYSFAFILFFISCIFSCIILMNRFIDFSSQEFFNHFQIHVVFCRHFVFYSVQVSLIICTLKQNLKTKHSYVQWNVFKGVYFYWEKSTPQFKIEMISGEYFFPCGSKFFPGKYYSGSTFFPG